MERTVFIEASYLGASILFILGLRSLTRIEGAHRGMHQAMLGMLLAVIGTLLNHNIVDFKWIIAGVVIGSLLAYPLGAMVPMTAIPQAIAASHMFGAIAATLVGVAEYMNASGAVSSGKMVALGLETLLGSLTITGSFMAFGKLQGIVIDRPLTFRGQNAFNLLLFAITLGLFGYLIVSPAHPEAFYAMVGLALLIGSLWLTG